MIAIIKTGASFKGAELYDEGKMQEGHKIIRTLGCNGIDMDYDENGDFAPDTVKISRSFRLQANLNPKVEKPVKHIVLSWPPEDLPKLTDAEMLDAAKEYLEGMGYSETQYLITRHLEKNNPHIHIITNLVNDKGKRIKDFQEHKRSVKICRAITERRGYTLGRHKSNHKCEIPQDCKSRIYESARYDMAKAITVAIGQITDISKLPAQLIADGSGITAKIKYDENGIPRGISFSKTIKSENGQRIVCKFTGSAIDRKLSCGNIVKLIDMQIKFPELRKNATDILITYDEKKSQYIIPKAVQAKCEELRLQLSSLSREEYRLQREIPKEAVKGYVTAVLALAFGSPLLGLITFLSTFFLQAIKENRLERVMQKRENVRSDYYDIKNVLSEKPPVTSHQGTPAKQTKNEYQKEEKKVSQVKLR